MNKLFYLPLIGALGLPVPLFSQCLPTGAKVCVSGDDTTQVWVNGFYLGSKNYCDLRSGCTPESLSFPLPLDKIPGPQVCLAVETLNVNPVKVFSSWELEVDCAGGKPFVVTDENPEKSGVSLYWDPNGGSSCGVGTSPPVDARGSVWTDLNYNPASNPFTLTGETVTAETYTCAQLINPLTGFVIHYLSYDSQAAGSGPTKACGILYWRQIAQLPVWVQTPTPTEVFTPTRVFTPTPFPTAVPTLTPTPIPPLPTPTLRPRPRRTLTPLPPPRPVRVTPQVRRVRIRPTATFVPFRPTSTWTPLRWIYWTPTPLPPPPKPTAIPAWLPPLVKGQVIAFQVPPVQIYVTFEDGPGRYQLEVVDGRGSPLQLIFDKKILGEGDSWATWDGKDSQGRDAVPGQYFVIFYKDGRPLRSISVFKTGK
jgi:hypothetical protein